MWRINDSDFISIGNDAESRMYNMSINKKINIIYKFLDGERNYIYRTNKYIIYSAFKEFEKFCIDCAFGKKVEIVKFDYVGYQKYKFEFIVGDDVVFYPKTKNIKIIQDYKNNYNLEVGKTYTIIDNLENGIIRTNASTRFIVFSESFIIKRLLRKKLIKSLMNEE